MTLICSFGSSHDSQITASAFSTRILREPFVVHNVSARRFLSIPAVHDPSSCSSNTHRMISPIRFKRFFEFEIHSKNPNHLQQGNYLGTSTGDGQRNTLLEYHVACHLPSKFCADDKLSDIVYRNVYPDSSNRIRHRHTNNPHCSHQQDEPRSTSSAQGMTDPPLQGSIKNSIKHMQTPTSTRVAPTSSTSHTTSFSSLRRLE